MVLTKDDGTPFAKPCREDFPPGIEGFIPFATALYAYHDAVAAEASKTFSTAFQKAMKGDRR